MFNPPNTALNKVFQLPQYNQIIEHNRSSYRLGNIIGQGNFGKVYECLDEWGHELVAKIIVPKGKTYEEIRKAWYEELEKLLDLRHTHITYIHDAFEYQDTFYLIIERCASTLERMFPDFKAVPNAWLPYVARDILHAIHFIHNYGYVHKDIHPGNVFLSLMPNQMMPNNQPVFIYKIGDLGIARLESEINPFGTELAQWMLAPEAISQKQFGKINRKMDIYHVGLLFLSLFLGEYPKFSQEETLAGIPRKIAENLSSPYGCVIARTLHRYVELRTETALDVWREIKAVS